MSVSSFVSRTLTGTSLQSTPFVSNIGYTIVRDAILISGALFLVATQFIDQYCEECRPYGSSYGKHVDF